MKVETNAHVESLKYEAEGIYSLKLRSAKSLDFTFNEAGAHIEVRLPNGICRAYTLTDCSADRLDFQIAVARSPFSKGGSSFIHETLRPGDKVAIEAVRNNFELFQEAPHSVFLAGGIGITPFLSMMKALNANRRGWSLYFAAKTEARAAFVGAIGSLAAQGLGNVHLAFTEEGEARFNTRDIVCAASPLAHLYCCGPTEMIRDFREACAARLIPGERVHVEYFQSILEPSVTGGFRVKLAKCGKTVFVPEGKTILDALESEGLSPPFSCREGICGECETRVLGGVPDHRDSILSESEKNSGKSMMICCSGSKSSELVLDL
jgi:vanillate O-demethylase ferredoxin subunit